MTDEVRPLYVLGAAHSGTTILYRMLALHPDAGWFSQYSLRDGTVPERRKVPASDVIDRWLRRRVSHDWGKNVGGLRARLVPTPKEAPEIWRYIFEGPTGRGEDSIARARNIIDRQSHVLQRDHFLGKWPRLRRYVRELHQAHSRSRFVHIVRDPRAVVVSKRDKASKLAKPDAGDRLGRSADRWIELIETVDALAEYAPVLEIRYESLCHDVHGALRKVLGFAELADESFPFSACPPALASTNEKRFREAGSGELDEIGQRTRHLLERFGYLERGSGPNERATE